MSNKGKELNEMARPYTEAKKQSNKRYDEKTYKTIALRLRLEEDADLIKSFEEARKNGLTGREWFRSLIEK